MLRRPDLPDLAFVAESHVFWRSEPGNVIVGAWRGSSQIPGMGDPWHVTENHLTAFTGYLWPKGGMWRDGEPWARQLAAHWHQSPFITSVQDLDGIYTAVSLSSSGVGAVKTDPLSLAMLYRGRSGRLRGVLVSSGTAARVASLPAEEPERDAGGVGWLAYLGYLADQRTGFANTVVLPVGAYVEVDPAWGSRIRSGPTPPWVGEFPAELSDEEPSALVHDDLAGSVRSTTLIPTAERVADITGGKDSRLVLALLLEAGATDRFTFRTIGPPSSADVIVSTAISTQFSLNHQSILLGHMNPDAFEQRLRGHVFQTSGTYNAWNLKGGVGLQQVPGISGGAGEMMRTFFSQYSPDLSPSDLHRLFVSRCDRLELLHPDIRVDYANAVRRELVETLDSGGCSTPDLLDAFYVRSRMRRWFGAAEELGEAFRIYPLYSLRGVQAAFASGPIRRRDETLHFAITRRACDRLARLPFADASWTAGAVSAIADGDGYRTPAQKAVPGAPGPRQAGRLTTNRDVVVKYLLDEPSKSRLRPRQP